MHSDRAPAEHEERDRDKERGEEGKLKARLGLQVESLRIARLHVVLVVVAVPG